MACFIFQLDNTSLERVGEDAEVMVGEGLTGDVFPR